MQKKLKGFSVLELVLTAALFSIFSLAIALAVFQGSSVGQAEIKSETARLWAREGLEAVQAIRNQSFDALAETSGTGIRFVDGKWEFSGERDTWEGFERVIVVQPARRDNNGNVVAEGGNEDADLNLATSTVTKDNFSLKFSAYLSRREVVPVGP